MIDYYSLSDYLKNTFGEKVYKISIDLGLTCPNRDGTLDTRGCIFCHAGSSHFAAGTGDLNSRIEEAKRRIAAKTGAKKFIAYFQSYTNTYAPVGFLRETFMSVINREEIVAISIATRPDCLQDEVISLLSELNKIKPVWVELGLQTANGETAKYIRRCYPNGVYAQAVAALRAEGLEVITHIILGLPGETVTDAVNTVDFAVSCGTNGVKLQLLHVLRDTDLCTDYLGGKFETLSLEEYTEWLIACLKRLPPRVVVHRLTGDAPKSHLVAPLWSGDKKTVMNTVTRALKEKT